MNWRAIRAIVKKDIRLAAQSKGVILPIILVPLILLVILPAGLSLLLSNEAAVADFSQESEAFLTNLPASIQRETADFENDAQTLLYLMLVYQFAPLFLILPLMLASVIGADSFAGEKERKTLEALLHTPTTDFELYAAKLLAAWLPAVVVALAGGVVYGVVVNVAAWPVMGRVFFPNAIWLLLVLWVAPAAAGFGLAGMVLVSSRVSSFQEAYQLGSLVVLPVVALMMGQVAGLVYLSLPLLALGGLVLWAIDAALLWYGARTFQRQELIARLA